MQILKTLGMGETQRLNWCERADKCDWDAGHYLAYLLRRNEIEKTFGENSTVLLLTQGEELVAFCTLAAQDEIDDLNLTPWIGFVYTFPQYRGHRYSGTLIEYTVKCAAEAGYKKIYVSSEEKGLYEKYGFEFVKNAMSVHGYETQIFERKI